MMAGRGTNMMFKLSAATWEKIMLMAVSALIGGAANSTLNTERILGRLEAVEKAIVRIDTRLYGPHTPTVKPDRAALQIVADQARFDPADFQRLPCTHVLRTPC